MRAILTHQLSPLTLPSSETEKLHIYNGLDCCVTAEVLGVLLPQLDDVSSGTYAFSIDLQAPVLEMNMRGVRVDLEARDRLVADYRRDLVALEDNFNRITRDGVGFALNWRSNQQLMELLYGVMRLSPVMKRKADGGYGPTVDRDALEKLENYFYARPIISHLLEMRSIGKKIGVLLTEIDSDGRMRTSYNIAGTTTGRLSSSLSEFGSGGNLQNIEQRLRRIFVSDPGYKFANIDLEQADSRNVGALIWNIFGDGKYLDACETGDLHTSVARLCWTNLPWTGDLQRDKEEVAGQSFYRQHSYRHMSKVLGHGTNFLGRPPEMQKHTKIPADVIATFQAGYFRAFPFIPRWQEWTKQTVDRDGNLITPLGRRRWFFGRRGDPATHREAVAFAPQSMTADILDQGMLQVWRANISQLLMQNHDAILVQYPEGKEAEVIPALLREIKVTLQLERGRTYTIPSEVKVGWNWADFGADNPDGLKKGKDDRHRTRPAATPILGRRLS